MSPETILVTGAAGGVGSTAQTAIAILLAQRHRVRAMVHKLDARADALRDMGAEVALGDMLDILAVRAAMQGCSRVYFTMSISPNFLEAAANVAVTAKSLGVRAFVSLAQMTLSQMSETKTTSSPQQKQEWLTEQMLRWSSLPVVYLRPTAFFDGMFLLQGAKGIRDDGVIRLPFADGKTSLIAGADAGAAAAAVLANPEPHIGKVYDLTGPQSLTMAQIAQEFSGALGRPIQYVNVPPQVWETKLRKFAACMNAMNARNLLGVWARTHWTAGIGSGASVRASFSVARQPGRDWNGPRTGSRFGPLQTPRAALAFSDVEVGPWRDPIRPELQPYARSVLCPTSIMYPSGSRM